MPGTVRVETVVEEQQINTGTARHEA